jgi:hypothetical protein
MIRFRAAALLCVLTYLACMFISRPFAEMGICDDWSYILTAKVLAETGHIVYNGWATAMLGWQLFPASWLIRLFGFSFATPRIFGLFMGACTVFLMHRIMVRAGIGERNATIGTLSIALTPLYMGLSASFMSDIPGLFAIVICLYGCIRALQAETTRAASFWICLAALANGVAGSSRQIAWLGVLVMVPCTVWMMRKHRQVLVSGLLATGVGCAIVAGCIHWFNQQPYALPEHVLVPYSGVKQLVSMAQSLVRSFLELPFLLLAVVVAFVPQLRLAGRRLVVAGIAAAAGYALLAVIVARAKGTLVMLEPTLGDWIGPLGSYDFGLASPGPVLLGMKTRLVLTALSFAGLFGVLVFVLRIRKNWIWDGVGTVGAHGPLSWRQIAWLAGPFTLATYALMVPRSSIRLLDRYLLGLCFLAVLCLIRAYQDFVRPALPVYCAIAVGAVALFSVASIHDMFSVYRARAAVAQEVLAAGVPANELDGGFEPNGWYELQSSPYIDDLRIVNPPNSVVPLDPLRGMACTPKDDTDTELIHFAPRYGVAYRADACRGPAPFAPVRYSRWLGLGHGTLYVVKYGPR